MRGEESSNSNILFYVLYFMKDTGSQEDGYVSHLGMKFQTVDEASSFWILVYLIHFNLS
jgi:hypothetical protein